MKRTLIVAFVALALVFGSVTAAMAYTNTQVGAAGASLSDGSTVNITATAKPKLTLTLPDTVAFAGVDPETTYTQGFNVVVHSNKAFTVSRGAAGGDAALMGLSVTGAASGHITSLGTSTLGESASINVPMTTPADQLLVGTVQYTVVQD